MVLLLVLLLLLLLHLLLLLRKVRGVGLVVKGGCHPHWVRAIAT